MSHLDAPASPPPGPRRWKHWGRLAALALLLLGVYGAALLVRGRPGLSSLPYVLRAVMFGLVSFLSSQWLAVLIIDGALALAWWLLPEPRGRVRRGLRRAILFSNRQISHLQAHVAGALLVFLALRDQVFQPPVLLFLLLFGPVLLDAAALPLSRRLGLRQRAPDPLESHWERRPLLYLLTAVALGALVLADTGHVGPILRLLIVVGLGLALRAARWVTLSARGPRGAEVLSEVDEQRRRELARWDRAVVGAALGLLFVPFVLPGLGHLASRGDQQRRRLLVRDCGLRGSGPVVDDVSLFLVADSQFHELRGERFGLHMDLVDSVVPVAVRPVELDLLSGVSLANFGEIYSALQGRRPGMRWAHLGDFADLACASELERLGPLLRARFRGPLAALAPGNHDSTFVGNFVWHPDWAAACRPSRPLSKLASDRLLLKTSLPLLDEREGSLALIEHPLSTGTGATRSALASVSRLGQTGGRDVLGVFLDSSDYTFFVLGMAGTQGEVSISQMAWVSAELDKHPRALVLLFLHHPLDELSLTSRRRIDDLGARLGRRLLAVVSAHTHLAAYRGQRLGGRPVAELVLGSTIDPPQEAALLELGPGADGRLALRLRTLQAVFRPEELCGEPRSGEGGAEPGQVSAVECGAILGRLRRDQPAACGALFKDEERSPEAHGGQVPEGSLHADLPLSPRDLRKQQGERARRLLRCVFRDDPAKVPADPFDPKGQDPAELLDGLYRDAPARRPELVCLSWVASWLQEHKRSHTLKDALDRAFSAPKEDEEDRKLRLPGEQIIALDALAE